MDEKDRRLIILKIAKQLKKEDLTALTFLYQNELGAGELEDKDRFGLMQLLYENGKLDDMEEFCKDLDSIGREDISAMVLGKEMVDEKPKVEISVDGKTNEAPSIKDKEKENKLPVDLLEDIANRIGSDWRRFARKLGHEEHIIEHIDCDYRKTYEKAYQVVLKWRESGDAKTWLDLKQKLEIMPRKDIIRAIESSFSYVVNQTAKDEKSNSQQESESETITKQMQQVVLTSNQPTTFSVEEQKASNQPTTLPVEEQKVRDEFGEET